MTHVPVAQAPADPALDAVVAKVWYGIELVVDYEHGWIATSKEILEDSRKKGWLYFDGGTEPPNFCLALTNYSTNIAAAWELVEELHKQMVFISLAYENDGCEWYCSLNNAIGDNPATIDFEIVADTAPLAITRAYLKAKGIEEVEIKE